MGQLSVDLSAHSKSFRRSLRKEERTGLAFPRYFTARLEAGRTPYDEVKWELRTASIGNDRGAMIFEQKDIEVPADWSQTATNIVASKYFHGRMGTPERERSVAQLVHRVVDTIAEWGIDGRYFRSLEDAANFRNELAHLMLTQKACFNSPVWFNVGVKEENRGYGWYFDEASDTIKKLDKTVHRPQCSACFINSVQDSLESILDLAKTEGMLFKWGSGTGTNLSTLREENALLWGGGRASGPLSFMKGFDAFAGVIKSGGKTRRAAKMVILNAEHPDVEQFIWCKAKEEKKAHTLIDAGYDPSLDGEAYSSIFFQNANNSVRATDEFMQAVVDDKDWWTKSLVNGENIKKYRARDLMRSLSEATWQCGDPGMQFDTTINRWHTSKNTDRINASNPCSEYMFLDDSACNLASLNLMRFVNGGLFDVEALRHAVDTVTLAQEIIVDSASYPTEKIARNSHDYRPLGLGFANLGSLLMSMGVPYDSEAGRAWAGAISAVMCGQSYLTSARIAEAVGPCPGYAVNEEPFLNVIKMHWDQVNSSIDSKLVPPALFENAFQAWQQAYQLGEKAGYRNAQTTVIAPTGTIGFMMDCDTTGVEPDLALVKYKKLVGGGVIKIVNNTVPSALIRLGYKPEQVEEIVRHIDSTGSIEGAPHLKAEHLPVFDCSFKAPNGTRFIHHMGHVRMMAAVQPFISGAISKTINMPEESTVEDVMGAYIESWKLGLKAVAIYRDGSKRVQPMSSGSGKGEKKASGASLATPSPAPARIEERIVYRPQRRKLPDERQAITHKFSIAGHEGYLTVGLFEDGTPGELFITMAKEGSTISGLMDSFATTVSYALQYGVPLKFFVDKFSHVRFEPSGYTGNPQITYAKSIMDYIFRWLALKFLGPNSVENEAGNSGRLRPTEPEAQQQLQFPPAEGMADAPSCSECGGLMTRNGSCYKCENCGGTSGCS
jgi:ribonucleoside-diphosphate reductase alpha chain